MGELWDWSQLAYLHGEDTSSLVSFVENGVECEVLAKRAPHLAPKATLFKHRLVPGVEAENIFIQLVAERGFSVASLLSQE